MESNGGSAEGASPLSGVQGAIPPTPSGPPRLRRRGHPSELPLVRPPLARRLGLPTTCGLEQGPGGKSLRCERRADVAIADSGTGRPLHCRRRPASRHLRSAALVC